MRVLEMPKSEKKVNDYVVLLKNGKTVDISSEIYDIVTDDDGIPFLYRFYKAKHAVLEIEARIVEMVADKSAVNVEAAIQAIRYRPRKKKQA